jgi:hypothetical protein
LQHGWGERRKKGPPGTLHELQKAKYCSAIRMYGQNMLLIEYKKKIFIHGTIRGQSLIQKQCY